MRPLSDSTYVVSYSGLLFRAFHSDFAGVSFINAQDLETADGKYFYLTYRLSDDGKQLYLRIVNDRGDSRDDEGLSHCPETAAREFAKSAVVRHGRRVHEGTVRRARLGMVRTLGSHQPAFIK